MKEFTDSFEGSLSLHNDSEQSDPVGVSNLRVWQETHADTEGRFWRLKTGYGYGRSESIQVDSRIAAIADGDIHHSRAVIRRAERLGFDGLADVLTDLNRISQYPILDEDDESQAEQEEQEEHWENYGRSDFERALEAAMGDDYDLDGVLAERKQTIDQLYWEASEAVSEYPERIDTSAWDFHTESRYGREPKVLCAAVDILTGEGPLTLRQTITAMRDCPERAVLVDMACERGE
jgi:hypothetical protein